MKTSNIIIALFVMGGVGAGSTVILLQRKWAPKVAEPPAAPAPDPAAAQEVLGGS